MEHERTVRDLAVERYFLGEMTAAEQEVFEEHYFECTLCAEDVRAATQFVEDARHVWSVGATPLPTPTVRPASPWLSFAWLRPPVAAASIAALLVIACAGTLMTLDLRQRLNEATSPRLVELAALRPLTRGQPTTLAVVSGEPVVLQFDLPETDVTDVQVELRSADVEDDDAIVFSLSGDPPASGEVTLSIPRFDLPAGEYTLIVNALTATGERRQVAQFPLEVRGLPGDQ
jgi:hypothetical protein